MLEARGLVHLLDLRIADMEAIREDIEAFQRKTNPRRLHKELNGSGSMNPNSDRSGQRLKRFTVYEPKTRNPPPGPPTL